jgi:hypothetical protein
MSDIIERANVELAAADPFYTRHHLARLVPELIAELKAAREELTKLCDEVGDAYIQGYSDGRYGE